MKMLVAIILIAAMTFGAGWSAVAQIDLPPPEIWFTNSYHTQTSLTVEWASQISYDFYQIRGARNGDPDGQDPRHLSCCAWVESGLLPNTTYHFIVQGCDSNGLGGTTCSQYSRPIEVTTSPVPLPFPFYPMAKEKLRDRADVSWSFLSSDPRSLHFIVQQRIGGTEWVNLGNTGRHQDVTYRLSVNYHRSDNPLRVCTISTTAEPWACTEPVTPAPIGITDTTRPNDTRMALHPPPPGIKQSARVNDAQTAPRLGASDTLNAQKVLPTIQQPSAIPQSSPAKMVPRLSPSTSLEQNAVVNSQPLLRKPLTTTLNSSTSRIFLRGVPQEGSTPAGTPPAEPKPAP
jgi:hypothetical protein